MDKKITAVIVTYNRKELLKEAIEAILSGSKKPDYLLVIDNNSTDGTNEYLASSKLMDKITYINTGANLGGAGGFNFGIKEAIKLDSDYIWIMDDDCIPTKDALLKLAEFAVSKEDKFGYLSSRARWIDGSPCVMNVQRKNLRKEITDFDHDAKIKLASFVSLFINTKAIEDLGLPIKDFYIWGDDWEYTYRLSKKYDCYYVAASEVTHKCKANRGVNIAEDNERLDRYFYAYRNEGYFYKHAGLSGRLYYSLKVLYHKLKIKGPNKKEKLAIIKKGKKALKTFKPKIEYTFRPSTKLNVVLIVGENLTYGGEEAFIINMLKGFTDNNKYTLVTPFKTTNAALKELVKEKGGRIYSYKYYSEGGVIRKMNQLRAINNHIQTFPIDVIHINSSSLFAIYYFAKKAKKHHIKKVIIHSHAGFAPDSFTYRMIKRKANRKLDRYTDIYFSCSDVAAEAKFPPKIVKDESYVLIKNGVNVDAFHYNEEKRKEYRKLLGLEDHQIGLVNVGRLSYEKNQEFLLKICRDLDARKVNFKCFICGQGELRHKLESLIKEYGLQEKVILLGVRNDVANIFAACDFYLLPSLFEGLSVTSVESQCSGLYTLISDTITRETDFTDIITFLPIDNTDPWVKAIMDYKKVTNRGKYAEIVREQGFDYKDSAKVLETYYRGYNK